MYVPFINSRYSPITMWAAVFDEGNISSLDMFLHSDTDARSPGNFLKHLQPTP